MAETATQPILEIDNLSISFFTRIGEIPAVMDFSCKVMPGEGDGPGRRIRLRQVDRALWPSCATSPTSAGSSSGQIKFKGRDMGEMCRGGAARTSAAREIAMIYQEPMASLNPAMKIGRAADGSADDPRQGLQGRGLRSARSTW